MPKPENQWQPLLWLDDHRGIYIPRDFANSFKNRDKSVQGVDAEIWAILEAGPDHEDYWDAWDDVLSMARVVGAESLDSVHTLFQDGALWLVPEGMEWSDKEDFFIWPVEDEEPEDETIPMRCDQCEMVSIQGVPCHETGCPNSRKEWNGSEWVWPHQDEDDEGEEG